MNKENYKKLAFQLNEILRHLLIDSDDIKNDRIEYWMNYWNHIQEENNEVIKEIYTINQKRY